MVLIDKENLITALTFSDETAKMTRGDLKSVIEVVNKQPCVGLTNDILQSLMVASLEEPEMNLGDDWELGAHSQWARDVASIKKTMIL